MTDKKKWGRVRLIDFLIFSVLFFSLPFAGFLAYLYYMELSSLVSRGFDEQLKFTTAGVSYYLNNSDHDTIADYRQIRSIVSTPAGVIASTGIGGDTYLFSRDLKRSRKIGNVETDVHDLAWSNNRLYVAGEGEMGVQVFDTTGPVLQPLKPLEFPFVCNGLAILPETGNLMCLGEVAVLVSSETGEVLESKPRPEELALTTSLSCGKTSCDGLVMGDEGSATIYRINPSDISIQEKRELAPEQSLFGIDQSRDRVLLAGSWNLEILNPDLLEQGQSPYPAYFDRRAMDEYVKAGKVFKRIRDENGLTYLFSSVLTEGDNDLQYTIDSTQGWEHSMDGMVDPTDVEEGIRDVWFKAMPYISGIKYWDEWGLLKSGYYPILDEKRVTGMVGADVNIGIIEKRRKSVLSSVILVSTFATSIALLLLWPVALSIIKPIEKLRRKILQITAGGGPFEPEEKELAALRELYIELEEMRLEIDREKRKFSRDRRMLDSRRGDGHE